MTLLLQCTFILSHINYHDFIFLPFHLSHQHCVCFLGQEIHQTNWSISTEENMICWSIQFSFQNNRFKWLEKRNISEFLFHKFIPNGSALLNWIALFNLENIFLDTYIEYSPPVCRIPTNISPHSHIILLITFQFSIQ